LYTECMLHLAWCFFALATLLLLPITHTLHLMYAHNVAQQQTCMSRHARHTPLYGHTCVLLGYIVCWCALCAAPHARHTPWYRHTADLYAHVSLYRHTWDHYTSYVWLHLYTYPTHTVITATIHTPWCRGWVIHTVHTLGVCLLYTHSVPTLRLLYMCTLHLTLRLLYAYSTATLQLTLQLL